MLLFYHYHFTISLMHPCWTTTTKSISLTDPKLFSKINSYVDARMQQPTNQNEVLFHVWPAEDDLRVVLDRNGDRDLIISGSFLCAITAVQMNNETMINRIISSHTTKLGSQTLKKNYFCSLEELSDVCNSLNCFCKKASEQRWNKTIKVVKKWIG